MCVTQMLFPLLYGCWQLTCLFRKAGLCSVAYRINGRAMKKLQARIKVLAMFMGMSGMKRSNSMTR